jgi:hypothetical protein
LFTNRSPGASGRPPGRKIFADSGYFANDARPSATVVGSASSRTNLIQEIESGDDAGNIGDGRPVVGRPRAGRREDFRVVRRRVARRHVLVLDNDRLGHSFQEQNRLPVAADARRVRFDNPERERDRDAGIDDVAASLEHRGAGG